MIDKAFLFRLATSDKFLLLEMKATKNKRRDWTIYDSYPSEKKDAGAAAGDSRNAHPGNATLVPAETRTLG